MANLTTSWQEVGSSGIGGLAGASLKLYAKYNSQSIANNNTSVSVELRIVCASGTNFHCYTHNASFNGAFTDSTYVGSYYHGWESNTTTTILSATKDIGHNSDGTKSISVGGSFSCSAGIGGEIGAVALVLPTIPRDFSSTPSLTVTSLTETTISYNWSTSETCNQIRFGYKLPSASSWTWQTAQSVNAKSGSSSASGLTAGTTYDIVLECRRADSNRTLNSNVVQKSTYIWPTVSTISRSSITLPGGTITSSTTESQVLTISNPLNRTGITVYAETVGTANAHTWSLGSVSGTSATLLLKVAEAYDAIGPNAKRGNLKYYCVYDNHTTAAINGEIVTSEANCRPIISSGTLSYKNNTPEHVTLLGSDQYIIQGKSGILIQAPLFSTVANTASEIDHYELTWNNSSDVITLASGTGGSIAYASINDASNVNISIKAIDKRGYSSVSSAATQTTINVLPYSPPTITLSPSRTGDYEDATGEITITATRTALTIGGVDKNHWKADSTNNKITYTMTPTNSSLGAGGTLNFTVATFNTSLSVTSLNPESLYTIAFDIRDEITALASESAVFPQAESLFDFNLEAPAMGIGAVVNKANTPTGLHAHGLYITDKTGTANTSQILSSTVEIGKSTGEIGLKGYTSISSTKSISNPIASKTGGTITNTAGDCSASMVGNEIIQGEIYIGGPQSNTKNGKIYLYNGTAYIPIVWYQSNS